MREPSVLLVILVLCACCALIAAPAAADTPATTVTTEPTVTLQPVTAPITEATTVPTAVPTTEPTAVPTTNPTTIVTTEPTTKPTTEPTITIPVTEPGGGKGYIDVYCSVNGASVFFNGNNVGEISGGVCSVGVSPSGTPVTTILVSKSGYTSWTGAPDHMPANGEHVSVTATLQPVTTAPTTTAPTTVPTTVAPQTGTIYAQSTPAGAAIYMNGNYYGYSPVTIPNLAPGSYTMKASLSGYTPDTQLINVYAGQTATYYPILQPSPPTPRSTGTLTVTSSPSGAQLYVDGNYQGKTPLTVTLYPGSHSVRLSLAGYSDYTTTVYVTSGTNQNLNAVMPPASFGTVKIISQPGASVFMDSNAQGKIPASGTLTLNNVGSGNHLFKVTASGYNDWLNTVYIQPNFVTTITATLAPVGTNPTPVPATGGIQIVSTPTGAEVYIDNLFRGYTPATLTDIAPGQHDLLLRYTGYVDYTQTVAVTSGQTTPLAISMQAAPTPTPASPASPILLIGAIAIAAGISALARRRS